MRKHTISYMTKFDTEFWYSRQLYNLLRHGFKVTTNAARGKVMTRENDYTIEKFYICY